MTATNPAQALADATAALVGQRDVHDILASLMADCLAAFDVAAVGVMVRPQEGELELLSASSHRAAELELFQIQREEGPCQETVRTGAPVSAASADEIVRRWHEVGKAIVDAGFQSVHAFPMRWQGLVLGGLNLFRTAPGEGPDDSLLGQSFADVMTLLLVRPIDVPGEALSGRIRQAIAGRAVIEQAKGVLCQQFGTDMGESYRRLLERARTHGRTVTEMAEETIRQAHAGGLN
jgi:hypothetical protein